MPKTATLPVALRSRAPLVAWFTLHRVQVSVLVRLAVGMTAAQVSAGADVALAEWLARPETALTMAQMYAPDAVISWLHRPEVWYQKVRCAACCCK